MRTVAFATLGCKVNQAETEAIAAGFARAGLERRAFGEVADIYVVNTCTVTHIADRKSRQLLRQARRLNPEALVVVTGCFAEVAPEKVADVDGLDLIVGNRDKDRLVALVLGHEANGACSPAPGLAGSRTRAFVKVQDGCDSFCTYCIVPRARGPLRSVPQAEVIAAVRAAVAAGHREVVLTGVHVGAYGRDLRERGVDGRQSLTLAGLIRAVLEDTPVERVRLSSIEPEDLTPDLLELWAADDKGRLCRHFHLPLQSGSDSVLRRMGRRYTTADYARVVAEARRAAPGVAITTDLMVGFPGESEAEFAESLEFVRAQAFAGMHVFRYSPRPGTAAARLPKRVPAEVSKRRSEAMIALAATHADAFRRAQLGLRHRVLLEEQVSRPDGRLCWTGLSDNYVRFYVEASAVSDTLVTVTATSVEGDGLSGRVLEGSAAV